MMKGYFMPNRNRGLVLPCLLSIAFVSIVYGEPVPETPASGPVQGKEAVIQRIQSLFSGTASPIVQTRSFEPAKPYMSIRKIPAKDELSSARAVIVYRMRFADVVKAQDAVEGIVGENGTVEISSDQNMIVINLEENALEAVKDSLLALDQPQPQVLVEAQIVEVQMERGEARDMNLSYTQKNATTGHTTTYGIGMTSPGQKFTDSNGSAGQVNFFPIDTGSKDGDNSNLNIMLKWLATSSDAKILASPNIIADLNSEATMKTGEEIPYNEAAVTNTAVTNNFKFKKTGINLRIRPLLINEDTVRLEIQPEINLLLRYDEFPQTGSSTPVKVPVVSIRNISTILTAADGEVIMMGGLYSSERSERLRRVPYLGELPLIGDLFTGKDLTIYDKQLLFFMKIHILPTPYSVLTDPEANAATLRSLGETLRGSPVLFREKEKPKYTAEQEFFPAFRSWWFGPEETRPDGLKEPPAPETDSPPAPDGSSTEGSAK